MGKRFSRQDFLQIGTVTLGVVALSDFAGLTSVFAADTCKSKVLEKHSFPGADYCLEV